MDATPTPTRACPPVCTTCRWHLACRLVGYGLAFPSTTGWYCIAAGPEPTEQQCGTGSGTMTPDKLEVRR